MALIRTGGNGAAAVYQITEISGTTTAQTISCSAGDIIYITTNDNRSTFTGLTLKSKETVDYNEASIFEATGSTFTVTPYNSSTAVFIFKPV